MGIAGFSHWILDLLVHVPDLPLIANRYRVWFGLWNYPATLYWYFPVRVGRTASGTDTYERIRLAAYELVRNHRVADVLALAVEITPVHALLGRWSMTAAWR